MVSQASEKTALSTLVFFIRKSGWRYLALLLTVLFSVGRMLHFLQIPTETDPGCFESIAFAMAEGLELYTDVWDHKPPGIFYLNMWALRLLGNSETTIFILQIITTACTAIFIFLLLEKATGKLVLNFFLSISFFYVWMEPGKFGSGNYTEQYGVLFALIAHWMVLRSTSAGKKQLSVYGAALFMGTALLFKESFLFTAAPLLIWIVLFQEGAWMAKISVSALVFCLMLLPTALFMVYFAWNGNLEGYMAAAKHTVLYAGDNVNSSIWERLWRNFHYIDGRVTHSMTLLLVAAIPGLMLWKRIPQKKVLVYFAFVLLFEFIATALPGNYYEHYYLQITPTIFVLLGILLAAVWLWLSSILSKALFILFGLIMLTTLLPQGFLLYAKDEFRLTLPLAGPDVLAAHIRAHRRPEDRIAVANYDLGHYYLQSECLPASRYLVPFNYHLIKGGRKKADENMRQLRRSMPRFILGKEPYAEFLNITGFNGWLPQHYSPVLTCNGTVLWEVKTR
jgi:4-amino-4-deoxy-L-arabinose transferase-like glycosyltransferase